MHSEIDWGLTDRLVRAIYEERETATAEEHARAITTLVLVATQTCRKLGVSEQLVVSLAHQGYLMMATQTGIEVANDLDPWRARRIPPAPEGATRGVELKHDFGMFSRITDVLQEKGAIASPDEARTEAGTVLALAAKLAILCGIQAERFVQLVHEEFVHSAEDLAGVP